MFAAIFPPESTAIDSFTCIACQIETWVITPNTRYKSLVFTAMLILQTNSLMIDTQMSVGPTRFYESIDTIDILSCVCCGDSVSRCSTQIII